MKSGDGIYKKTILVDGEARQKCSSKQGQMFNLESFIK